MTAPFPSLVRLYLRSFYGLRPLSELKKAGPKSILKAVGIVLLALFVIADLGFLFVLSNLTMYDALAPYGLQGLLLLNAATSAALVVFVFGFVMALSTYSLSAAEDSLLALPLDPRAFLGAKLIVVYFSEFLFSIFLFGTSLAVFGVKEGPSFVFYLYGLIAAAVTPLVPLAVAYLLLVPMMSAARFLRNKNAIMVVAGFLGMIFALAFNLYMQAAMARIQDPAWLYANYAGPDSILARIGSAYPPSLLVWRSLDRAAAGAGLAGIPPLIGLALIGAGATLAVVFLLGKPYAKSLVAFGEGVLKKIDRSEASRYIGHRFRSSPPLLALFKREFRLMNREPGYFLNGPFVVILMPVIFALMYLVQGETFSALGAQLASMGGNSLALLVSAGAGAFIGSATSITCTALSRDAKALPYLKALPISAGTYMLAKLLHGLVFSLLGALTGGLGLGLVLGLGPARALGAVFIAFSFSALADMAGLWLDTANPRLSWDNPIAALKQNPNAVIVILGAMGLIALLGWLSTTLPFGDGGFVIVYGGGLAALFGVLLALYPRYAETRLAEIEV